MIDFPSCADHLHPSFFVIFLLSELSFSRRSLYLQLSFVIITVSTLTTNLQNWFSVKGKDILPPYDGALLWCLGRLCTDEQ